MSLMKKIILGLMLLMMATSSFCQQTKTTQPLTSEAYLKKSKRQSVIGAVLIGVGVIAVATAFTVDIGISSITVASIGGYAALASIPFLIAADKNKKRALKASAVFKFEKAPSNLQNGISFQSFPAMGLKINF